MKLTFYLSACGKQAGFRLFTFYLTLVPVNVIEVFKSNFQAGDHGFL